MNRFAVEALPGEQFHDVAEVIIRTASELKLPFKRLEAVEWNRVGSVRILIVTADIANPSNLLDRIYNTGRAVVGVKGNKFVARIGKREAQVAMTMMLQVPRLNVSPYRGPGDPLWERQFTKA